MEKTQKTTSTESSLSIPERRGGSNRVYRNLSSFLSSKKLWMTLFGLVVLWLAYWKEVDYLYSFAAYENDKAQALIPAFISLTRDFMVAFTAVVASFLGIEGFISWRHGTESIISQATSVIKEERREDITQTNISIEGVIEEGTEGAPALKPFGRQADKDNG